MREADEPSTQAQREVLAEAFDQDLDPLAKFAGPLVETGVDPFELFLTEILNKRGVAPRTRELFRTVFQQWQEHMAAGAGIRRVRTRSM